MAAPRATAYKIGVGGGLYVFVTPRGAKSWRLKYRTGRKEKLITFGLYPSVSIEQARDRAEQARELLRAGVDPAERHAKIYGWNRVDLSDLDSLAPPINSSRVYFIQAATGHIKIGVSTNVMMRMASLQSAHPEPLQLLATMPGTHEHERVLHRAFDMDRDSGEWFSPSKNLLELVHTLRAIPPCR